MSPDLSVAIVSHGHEDDLGPCVSSLAAHSGDLSLDVVVVDNGPSGAGAALADALPGVRGVRAPNRGFAAGNNVALSLLDPAARWVLLLNPDTEVVEGDLQALLAHYDGRPEVGAVGVRQVDGSGTLLPSIRREPSPLRALLEALGSERWGGGRFGERELRVALYDSETPCDWTSGSFVLVRRAALDTVGGRLDERFFLYLEETDLCLRLRQAGWRIVHSPRLTIVHREGDRRAPSLVAQAARSRQLYAAKHFAAVRRRGYLAASALGWVLRAGASRDPAVRAGSRAALATLLGRSAPLEARARTSA